jgi:hypothetical protein
LNRPIEPQITRKKTIESTPTKASSFAKSDKVFYERSLTIIPGVLIRKLNLLIIERVTTSRINEMAKMPSSVAVVLRIELARILLNDPSTKCVGVFPCSHYCRVAGTRNMAEERGLLTTQRRHNSPVMN